MWIQFLKNPNSIFFKLPTIFWRFEPPLLTVFFVFIFTTLVIVYFSCGFTPITSFDEQNLGWTSLTIISGYILMSWFEVLLSICLGWLDLSVLLLHNMCTFVFARYFADVSFYGCYSYNWAIAWLLHFILFIAVYSLLNAVCLFCNPVWFFHIIIVFFKLLYIHNNIVVNML